MEPLPLKTVDDEFAIGRTCAICGESTLAVVHVEDLPDYVKCSSCHSAFILSEVADWAMFGSISSDFPETKQMALKRWTTLEAVRTMASSERIPEPPNENQISELTLPFGIGGNGAELLDAAQASTPPFGLGELDEFVAESDHDLLPSTSEPLEESADVAEPEPGQRFVVTLAQKTASFPPERCAHCLRRPAPKMLIVGLGPDPDQSYRVPLCQVCHDRASARTEEQKTSRLVAHLSSVLIGGLLIVGALVLGLIDTQNIGARDLLLIATLGLFGYGLPALLLVGRSARQSPSEDAQFVRSTLRLRDNGALAFGWRNRGYAELFSSANADLQIGDLTQVSDDQA
jgi:hypothetical protein